MSDRPRVGVSACLLGANVRYDGGLRWAEAVAALGRDFALVPLCPEVGAGMTVPRPPIRVARLDGVLRLVGVLDPSLDVTDAMDQYVQAVEQVVSGLDGYVFKCRSPSCGLTGIPVVDAAGGPVDVGAGRFAAAVRARCPDLPVIDEEALAAGDARRAFESRVRAYHAARARG